MLWKSPGNRVKIEALREIYLSPMADEKHDKPEDYETVRSVTHDNGVVQHFVKSKQPKAVISAGRSPKAKPWKWIIDGTEIPAAK
jgi:hypothetical protein